jgi:prepilin-type N-terminal cleavage/methylation domain-containing protein
VKTVCPRAPQETAGCELQPGGWAQRPRRQLDGAFTLLELLVVIAIIGILAAIAVPTMNSFKPDVVAAATQQLLTDLGRARQLAMSERTTVYLVFVPKDYYSTTEYAQLSPDERLRADRLLDKQMIGYNFVSLRSLGDQPGQSNPRYLSTWRTLPEGTFIAPFKFNPIGFAPTRIDNKLTSETFWISGFSRTNNIPFPTERAAFETGGAYVELPYIAFNYLGQLITQRDELIPLARGAVSFGRSATREATKRAPTFVEQPPGNSTNTSFNIIYIDWLTGRARVERQEVQ